MTSSAQGPNGRGEERSRPERGRFTSRCKTEVVLGLLRDEQLDALSRELGVIAATLARWRDRFFVAGEGALKSRPADDRGEGIHRLQAKVGAITMENQLLLERARSSEADSLWHAEGRGDESGQLALCGTPLRHGPHLPVVGHPPLDPLRAPGSGAATTVARVQARPQERVDRRRAQGADPLRARVLPVRR